LRQVQLAWLKSGDAYASPYYWAAFVVSGNDSPLDAGSSTTVRPVEPSSRGCACDASSPDLGQGSGVALVIGLVLFMLRRRRRTGRSVHRSHGHLPPPPETLRLPCTTATQ
jgi:MYXO-CTERM domain-containing protein